MNVLVLGGTRFFGVHLVRRLLSQGRTVTIATRGNAPDPFGAQVSRVQVDRTDGAAMAAAFQGRAYDVVYDNIAYCSNDVRAALEAIACKRYILTSSASIYQLHPDTREAEWLPSEEGLVWCNWDDCDYDEGKRRAECALLRWKNVSTVAVRFPFVIGPDDYTGRLRFYLEHVRDGLPMYIDNLDAPMSFISSEEAGRFLAFLADSGCQGPINGCSRDTVSMRAILNAASEKTGRTPVLSPEGDPAPYNGAEAYSLNTSRANDLGFVFSSLHAWLPALLDQELKKER
ncbi:MAG: NAD-dependent epimerase/dehydratase family protein [Oscillospiraceae bacterium]|nr:NAD-dependent epimerase/dehydratase family protein [Oscillospiraceae bacterium]